MTQAVSKAVRVATLRVVPLPLTPPPKTVLF